MKTSTRRLLAGATATALSVTGAVALGANASAAQGGVLLYGLSSGPGASQQLVQFRAETGVELDRDVIAVAADEDVVGIDVRPATGQLYAVVDGPTADRVVVVDPSTGALTASFPLSVQLSGVNFGVDFNPVVDRLRIVSDAEQNLRVDVTTGAALTDTPLAYAPGDARSGDPSVRGAAYTSNVAGAGATVLFDYDAATGTDAVVRQDPANSGRLVSAEAAPAGVDVATTAGLLPATGTATVGFDVEAVTDLAYLLVESGGSKTLFRSSRALGAGGATAFTTSYSYGLLATLTDITVASPRLTVQDGSGTEGGSAVVTVTRSGDLGDAASAVLTPTAGSADASDVDLAARTATFAPGATSATVSFPLYADAVADDADTFTVRISSASSDAGNAAATARVATVTVTNGPPPAAPAPSTPAPAPTQTTPAPQPTDPRPSLSPAPPGARRLGISTNRSFITPGVPSTITITGQPGVAAELYAYSRPSIQYRLVRSGTIPADGTLEYPILPGTNTRLFAAVAGQTGNESLSLVVNVRTAISLSVRRTGTRQYVFEGRLLPRNQSTLVSLYRVTPDGREVLTAQARSNPAADGLYRITRRFTGTGSFFFVVRTSQTLINAPGLSNVRTVAIR